MTTWQYLHRLSLWSARICLGLIVSAPTLAQSLMPSGSGLRQMYSSPAGQQDLAQPLAPNQIAEPKKSAGSPRPTWLNDLVAMPSLVSEASTSAPESFDMTRWVRAAMPFSSIDASNWVWQPLISNSWTIPANAGGNFCVEIPVNSEAWVDGLRPTAGTSAAFVHALLYATATPIVEGKNSSPIAGTFVCPGDAPDENLIYAWGRGGVADQSVQLPAGDGVHLPAGSYLLLFVHVDNALSTTSSADTSGVEVHFASSANPPTNNVNMVLSGLKGYDMPAGDEFANAIGDCFPVINSGNVWHIVGMWPHMLQSGRRSTISLVTLYSSNSTREILLDADYESERNKYYPLGDISISNSSSNQGVMIETQCSMQNANLINIKYDEETPEQLGGSLCWVGIYKYHDPGNYLGDGKAHYCVSGYYNNI